MLAKKGFYRRSAHRLNKTMTETVVGRSGCRGIMQEFRY